MAIEVGAKVAGKVSGITNFGAFIDLGDHKTGLVHISEVSDGFVKDIHDVLSIGDEVTVKVLNIGDDGKIALSIRKAQDKPEGHSEHEHHDHERHESNSNHHSGGNSHYRSSNNNGGGHPRNNSNHSNSNHKESFDDLMSGFLKESEDRLATLKRNTEGKRGGRGGRRS
ncbi:RNA-binding protein S1 [Lactobacillus sp. LC28-10]|uniref:RNA-binding protein S1 n=1 Tax=Secundilactobacillus angelensis TaxID=2722706 RepID=A0ABX1L0F1_9LACO|nr:S1 domain-containing RNA-binding protein [Secundilactobacillus angelensis]MCH5463093.1 S1 domain-containing RNA-binding protein [Secundilactobacillus angelensis]NLR18900.1 RNA-binding protein S1 [Secundilactobacillus angelensis]